MFLFLINNISILNENRIVLFKCCTQQSLLLFLEILFVFFRLLQKHQDGSPSLNQPQTRRYVFYIFERMRVAFIYFERVLANRS